MEDEVACPICTMTDLLDGGDSHECATCGHEWPKEEPESGSREVRDANGNLLNTGDTVTLIKDLKINGKSGKLKVGTKITNIRIVDGDHEIDCKVEGRAMLVKAEFVRRS